MATITDLIRQIHRAQNALNKAFMQGVQDIADRYNIEIATGHMSDYWQVRAVGNEDWRAEYEDLTDASRTVRLALKALKRLESRVQEFGIGPTNLMFIQPQKTRKGKGLCLEN